MKLEGKSPRQYVEEQFPATVGHIPLQMFFEEVETLESKLLAVEKENQMLREANAQLVASEQSIRNESNRLRVEVRELKGRIANALL